jgi:hypothetical protein
MGFDILEFATLFGEYFSEFTNQTLALLPIRVQCHANVSHLRRKVLAVAPRWKCLVEAAIVSGNDVPRSFSE